MKYICLIICIVLLTISLIKDANLYKPTILMHGLWTVIVFLNILELFGLKKSNDVVYEWVIIGQIAFYIGHTLGNEGHTFTIYFKEKKVYKEKEINYKMVYILGYITIILLLIDTIIAVRYLLNGASLVEIRSWLNQTYEEGTNPITARKSYFEQVFRVLVIEPFKVAIIPICASDMFTGNGNRKMFFITVIIVLLNVISTGGSRISILTLAISVIMAYLIIRRKGNNSNKKIRKKIRTLSLIGVIIVVFLTMKRSKTGVVEEGYYYFSLCLPLLNSWITDIINCTKTYGLLSFWGIVRIPFLVIEKLGFPIPNIYYTAQECVLNANKFRNVGERIANSFVTPYYYLYIDAGVAGIFIGMFIFGIICGKSFRKLMVYKSQENVIIHCLLMQAVLLTFIRWQFVSTGYFLSFIILKILLKDKED